MSTIYVVHHGSGRDGGFGDYAGVYWSDLPLEINGRTVWFDDEDMAGIAVEILNQAASKAFYDAGHGGSYTGDFPIEYEYRKLETPKGDALTAAQAVEIVMEHHQDAWKQSQYGDIADCGGCDQCEDCCAE